MVKHESTPPLTQIPARRAGEVTHVWVPPATADRYLAALPKEIVVHKLPTAGPDVGPLGPGQFVVADFWRRGFLDVLGHLEGVRVVQAISAGVEDLDGRMPPGAILCDGAGIHDAPVADWVVMAILAMYRRLPQHVIDQAHSRWAHPGLDPTISDLEGSTALILGYGSIGRAVESRLTPFGVDFLRVGRVPREGVSAPADLPSLLPRADVVVVLLPLTKETHHFVDSQFLGGMKPNSLLVNPSRGGVVDTDALIEALHSGRIRAALDVTDPEPLPEHNELWTMPRVLITPHIAGSVSHAYDRAWKFVAAQVRRYLAGEPLSNVVSNGY